MWLTIFWIKYAFSFAMPSCKWGKVACYVCCVNPTNLVLWFEALHAIWYHVCLFLITRPLVHHKNKSNSLELDCEKIFHIKLYGQTLTTKYKGLTMKVETKYVLTNWFSDYQFWFNQSTRSLMMRITDTIMLFLQFIMYRHPLLILQKWDLGSCVGTMPVKN